MKSITVASQRKGIFSVSLLFVLLSFFTLPANGETKTLSSFIDIPVEKHRLKNGLTVLLNPNPNASLVAYYWGIPIGSRHESKGQTGISHMFEHLMFRGTKKYPDMNSVYDKNGIVDTNAWTSYDFTGYFGKFPLEKSDLVLDVESDRIAHLILNKEVLEKERKAVQEERYMSLENNPKGFLFVSLMSLIFKKHPYKWPIIGYKQDIASYKLQDLKKWYRTYYSPGNIVLALSGPFSNRKVKKQIEKYFGPLERQKLPEHKVILEPEQKKSRQKILKKSVQTTEIRLAYVGPGESSMDFVALEAISLILGGGESSRLYQNIVKQKKLLPDIWAGTMDFVDHSVFMISFALPKGVSENRVKALLLKEITGLSNNRPITQKEIQKVKNILLNDQVQRLKKSSYRAYQLAYYEMQYGDYKKLYSHLKAAEKLSPDLITHVANRYLDPKKLNYLKMKAPLRGNPNIHK